MSETSVDERIAELAHELKTPLTGVLGAIDLVVDAPVALDENEIEELLAVARSEANHLRSIIDGIVQRARLDAGKLEVDRKAVSAIELVDGCLARFPGVSDRTALTGDVDLVVSTDPSVAEQILTNLIQNIARYAPVGPVMIEFERQDDQGHVVITDSGPGLPGGKVPSSKGLGVGLSTSRRLADMLGGSLASEPSDRGARFRLTLPASHEKVERGESLTDTTPPPRARLLQEVADLLVGTSLERILTGVSRLGREMLGASTVRVLERRGEQLLWLTVDGVEHAYPMDDTASFLLSLDNGIVTDLDETPGWLDGIDADEIAAVTMRSTDSLDGLLVVGWGSAEMPGFAGGVLPALAALALVGVDRRSLGAELDFERRVRAEVMDSLPIAISIFAGEPPRLIGQNRMEREMLRLDRPEDRPERLQESQQRFDVRFEDGTSLTEENSPVFATIRTGLSAGPFYLRVTRTDGSEVRTRTYCAPVRDGDGAVIGAVVTSEPVEV